MDLVKLRVHMSSETMIGGGSNAIGDIRMSEFFRTIHEKRFELIEKAGCTYV